MKQNLLKTWLMLVCLLVGVGSVWAEDVTFNYSDYQGNGTSSTGSAYKMDDKSYVSINESKFYGNTSYAQFYAGGTITVTPKNGSTITKISVKTTSTSYNGFQNSGKYTPSIGNVKANTSNNTIVEWTGSSSDEFTIKHDKQIRWTEITVTYSLSGGSDPTPTKYNVSIANDIQNGTVKASPTSAEANATVTLTATPATGYEFSAWDVKDASNNAITVTDNKFTMPAANVNVSATFTKTSADPDPEPGEGVTYTFASFTQATDVTLEANGYTIALHKNTGSTAPQWNGTAKEARVYAKGSVEISSTKTITKIVYNYVENAGGKNNVVPTVNGATGSTDDGTWDAKTKTWTGSDNKVTLTTSGSAGNLGFKSITVYFSEGGDPDPLPTPTLSFANPTYNATLGEAFTAPTLNNPQEVAVTYASSNTGVATVNVSTGAVELVAAGTTTITASFAGNDEYTAAFPASYTLTVSKAPFVPVPVEEGGETVDFAALYSTVTTSATVEDYEGTSFAMTFAKPESSKTPTKYYYNGKAARAYEGNTITISAAENIYDIDLSWVEGYVDDEVEINGIGTKTAVITFSKTCRFTTATIYYQGTNIIATDGESYYATFSSARDVQFASAAEVYAITVSDSKMSLKKVKDNQVSAGNGVLIKSSVKDLAFLYMTGATFKASDDTEITDNMLVPTTTTGIFKAEADGNNYYKLAYGDNTNKTKLGFWFGAEGGSGNFKVKAGGAVLCVPQSAGVKGFSLSGGDETAIENLMSNNKQKTIYNLQGVKLQKLQKGVNIVNGRKVIR